MKLDLGAGNRRIDGFTRVDYCAACNPDVVHDLTVYPWPFNDGSIEEIVCTHVLEHLIHQGNAEEFFAFFKEAWRVLQQGGVLQIVVPDANSAGAFADPWHKSAWSKDIFAFISKNSIAENVQRGTRMSSVELDFDFGIVAVDVADGDIKLIAVAIK